MCDSFLSEKLRCKLESEVKQYICKLTIRLVE